MFLEQILEDLSVTNKKLKEKVERLEKIIEEKVVAPEMEYVGIKQLANSGKWPYSEMATRKMIERGKFIEGIHYKKIDGRVICHWPSMKEYLENRFYQKRGA